MPMGAAIAGSAILGAMSSANAADAQSESAAMSTAEQRRQYDLTRQDQAPWREAGLGGLNKMEYLLGTGEAEMKADPDYGSLLRDFGLEDFTKDPGYDFRLSEGEKGINRSLAARGGLFSGAAGKALSRYNQDFASNEYGNAYNRYNTNQGNKFNRLASLAGIGQSATNQVQQAGQNAANNISSNMIGSGNAQASGIMGIGNAISGGLNNYMQYNMMNKMLGN